MVSWTNRARAQENICPNFHRLIEGQIPRLRRYARALTRYRERADDLLQDTLGRALRTLGLPIGAVRSRLSRGRDVLRKLLDMEEPPSAAARPKAA